MMKKTPIDERVLKLTFAIHQLQDCLEEGITTSRHIQSMPENFDNQHEAQCYDDDTENGVIEWWRFLGGEEALHWVVLLIVPLSLSFATAASMVTVLLS